MADFDQTLVDPTPADCAGLLAEAARAANHRCPPALVRERWPAAVARLAGPEGVRRWAAAGRVRSEVACAWWTDFLGRKHVRIAGRRYKSDTPNDSLLGLGSDRPPLLLTCPAWT